MNMQSSRAAVSIREGAGPALLWAAVVIFGLAPGETSAQGDPAFCSRTADAVLTACINEVRDDYWIAIANCINVSDAVERQACKADAGVDREDGLAACDDQWGARLEVCDLVGGQRYEPDFDPANFVDPADIGNGVAPNSYFPLIPGNRWTYRGDGERIIVTVLDQTKLIEGVTCRVVKDVVREGGVVIELTFDWYAQDLDGNVWYCGEISQNFETFAGDDPEERELVDIDGSWKAGRDDAQPGIIMLAAPQVGDAYREEVSLGEAEDVAEVTSVTGTEMAPAADCMNTCVVTRNLTPLEPGIEETKYYAPGVGLILEVDGEGSRVELIEFISP